MTARARLALATIALLALIAVVYAPVLRGVFIWDDHALIETNDLVLHGTARSIFRMPYWTANPLVDIGPIYYRPITMLSFRADFEFAGTEARSYHATNLFMHLCTTFMLVLAARRFGASPGAAVIAAAVWALHPRTTESVAWIAGRTDVLAAGFGLAALGLWPWFAEPRPDPAGGATSRATPRVRAVASALALLLALLAKEVAIVFVLAIAVGTITGASTRARGLRSAAWLAVPLAVYVALRSMATRSEVARLPALGGGARFFTMLEAAFRYVEMTLDGWHPASSIGLVGDLDHGRAALGAVLLLTCAAFAMRAVLRRERTPDAATETAPESRVGIVVASVLGVAPLALVVHILPITLASGVAADRLLYLPLAGLALGAAVAAEKLTPRRRRIAAAAALVLAATFIPVTHARARDYTSELQFRVVAAEHAHPHNTAPKSGLANALRANGELALACRLHASVRRSLEADSGEKDVRYIRALENLGGCYAEAGEYERAAAVYADLVALRPASGRVQMEIGFLELHTFALDRAEVSLRRAVELEPTLTLARHTLESLPELRALLTLSTDEARAKDPFAWAELCTSLGRVPDATKAWLALALDPTTPDVLALPAGEFVIAHGDADSARRVGEALRARNDFRFTFRIESKLAARLAKQARIDALRARIEALAPR